jgi:hypothetical protein
MALQRGTKAGVSGIIELSTGAQFHVEPMAHGGALAPIVRDRTGRGSGGHQKVRLGTISGGGTVKGTAPADQYPIPTELRGATGNLRFQMHDGDYVTIPVVISNAQWSFAEATKDRWDLTIAWTKNGTPSIAWAGSQTTTSLATANNQETYEGLQKIVDDKGLTTGAVQRFDCQGIDDTDAAETSLITSLTSGATAPISGLKLVNSTLVRTDSDACIVMLKWGLRTSEDEIEQDSSYILDDPKDLQDQENIAVVHNTSTPPANPTPVLTNVKIAAKQTKQLNDGKWITVYQFRTQDSEDEVEQGGTRVVVDSSAVPIASEKVVTTVSGDSLGNPSILGVAVTETKRLNDGKIASIERYEFQTPQQKVENDNSWAKREYLEPNEKVVTTLEATTSDPDTYIGTLASTFFAESGAKRITVKKVNPRVAQVTRYYVASWAIAYPSGPNVGGRTYAITEQRIAMVVGTETAVADAVKFYPAEVREVVSGQQFKVLFAMENKEHVIREFGFKRQFAASSITDYASMVGKANDATWNGLAKGTVKYAGAEYDMKAGVLTAIYKFIWRAEPWAVIIPPALICHATGTLTAGTATSITNLATAGVVCSASWNRDSYNVFGF